MNPTNLEEYSGEVCVDCLFLLANGEVPEERPDLADEIEEQWPAADGWQLVITCEEGCEGGFSWSSCDACGSTLGGDRHPFVAMRQEVDADYLAAMVSQYVETALWADPPATLHDWYYGPDRMNAIRQCTRCGEREAYWDDEEYPPEPCSDATFDADDLAPSTLEEIREECRQFIAANHRDLASAGVDAEQAGHDFYLTRNRHGAGFWDRGNGATGDRLADAARVWGTSELYAGDDRKLYAAG